MTRHVISWGGALLFSGALLSSCGDTTDSADFSDLDAAAGKAGRGGGSQGGAGLAGRGGTGGGQSGAAGRGGGGGSFGGTAGASGFGGGGASGKGGQGGGTGGRGGTSGKGGQSGSAGSVGKGGQSGASGQAGTAGGGAGGTVGTGGRPDAGSCPSAAPTPGSSCSPNGLVCSYGDPCCPLQATCQGGTWLVVTPACIAPSCPSEPPTNGTACDPCRHLARCEYDRCSTTGMIAATCGTQRQWSVTTTPCSFACGDAGLRCQQGQVCVVRDRPIMTTYECATNPCTPQPVSCSCASTLCSLPANNCVAGQTSGNRVTCTCLTCQ